MVREASTSRTNKLRQRGCPQSTANTQQHILFFLVYCYLFFVLRFLFFARVHALFRARRELRYLLTKELGIVMRGEEMRRLVDAFDTSKVAP